MERANRRLGALFLKAKTQKIEEQVNDENIAFFPAKDGYLHIATVISNFCEAEFKILRTRRKIFIMRRQLSN